MGRKPPTSIAIALMLCSTAALASCGDRSAGPEPGIGSAAAREVGYESTPLNNTYGYQTRGPSKKDGGNYSDDYDYDHQTYGFGYHAEKCDGRIECYRLEGRGY